MAFDWAGLLKSLLQGPPSQVPGIPSTGGAVGIPIYGTGYTVPKAMKPMTIWRPSPNFSVSPGRRVSCVVIHATATPSLASPLNWLCNPASKVSAHYLIDLDGTTYHLVLDEHVAWHAGVSSWKGRPNVNAFSVGIELVGMNNGAPYPREQVFSCARLCKYLQGAHGIQDGDFVSHAMVAPGRKNDPLGFDWAAFWQAMRGIA